MEENQDVKELSRVSVSGSSTGYVTGVQNIHADRNSTIIWKNVTVQSAMLERQKQRDALNSFTCQLKRIYQTEGKWMRQLPWLKEQPIENYYVDLNLELLDATGRKRLARLCQLQDILRDEPECLVTPAETILLSGPSGSGKTTLLRKMACLWASDTSPKLNKFKVLFIYSLKDLRESEDLGEAITALLQQSYQESSFVTLDIWLEEVKTKMLLLLDGYDELSEKGKAIFGRILDKDSPFFSSTIIVTTRLCYDLELNKRFVKHVTVSCLTDNSLNEGIDKYFSEDEQKKQRIKNAVLTNKGCADLFRTSPLLMYSLCYVFETKEIADITKLTDLCFHVVTMLLKRAAMEAGNHLTEEEILSVLNSLGEISAEQLFKGKPVFRLADLESRCPNELNVILRSGLFLQKEKSDHEFEILHNIFFEFLAARYWNNKFPEFRERRCIILNDILCKQNYFKSWLLITRNNEVFLAFQSAGMYILVKHGDFGLEYVLETEYDFVVIEKNCDWRYHVILGNYWLICLLSHNQGTVDLLRFFLPVLSVNRRHKTLTANVFLKGEYSITLHLVYLLDQNISILCIVSQFLKSLHGSQTSKSTFKDGDSDYVGCLAVLLSSYPYLIISVILTRYGGKRPIFRACAHTFTSTWLFIFYYSAVEYNDAVLIAFLALRKTRTLLSATLLTTSLMGNKFIARLFIPLLYITSFKLFFVTDLSAKGNLCSKFWNCAIPGAMVYLSSILIRHCFTKCIEYYTYN